MRPLRALPLFALLIVPLLTLTPTPGVAQDSLDRPLRVFLDCNGFHCDQDFFTEEVPWVDFVRDRQSADVHVLGTRQQTGGGGTAYTLEFRGRQAFEGQSVTLHADAAADATEDERRNALLRVIRLGLAPYAASTTLSPDAAFTISDAAQEEAEEAAGEDPWNRWVFRVGVDGFANGETQQSSLNASGSANASRVTEDWKLDVFVRGSKNESEFDLGEGEIFTSVRESYSTGGQVVKSLGPHWGVGSIAEWNQSTFNNYEHSAAIGAAVEYNVFPYSESNRRLLTVSYAVGPRYNEYAEETIFGETQEVLLHQLLSVSYDVTQPWGTIDVSANVDHYLAKLSEGTRWDEPQYNASLGGGLNLRLIRGLSARLHGSVSMVRGQIQLPAGDLTEEEILTRQRELATNYRYFMSFGLSYRFGSIFSDVINPRFEGF